ncbi:HET-domain-containing protein [Annulohypoxylon maeteangense]|uniref:HET-domain-containing protein n=1 Tax=Annulohypoxylon maeteangense TaxID=1927788 RepID=UPI002008D49A|nr:HET-domain-containing protein [Annulohypoxylon maeteangense]KAI0885828.1 HET-domain-containing protein [Annulohypoxylon maeteangense]
MQRIASNRHSGGSRSPSPLLTFEDIAPSNAETMLCSACQRIFAQTPRPLAKYDRLWVDIAANCYVPREEATRLPHHPTQQSFDQAVQDGCFICTKVDVAPAGKPVKPSSSIMGINSQRSYWQSLVKIISMETDEAHHATLRYKVTVYNVCEIGEEVQGRAKSFFMVPVRGRKPELNVPANGRLSQIKKWMTACCRHHEWGCVKYRRHEWARPSRLINVGPRGQDFVSLELFENIRDLDVPYITMSHRWLEPRPPVLERGNMAKLMRSGVSISSLPRSYQDAISIVRYVGIRYLWIDSLCILQDSQEDFDKEAKRMGNIYAGGVFNIVASNSGNWKTGLFSNRTDKGLIPIVQPSWPDIGNDKVFAINPEGVDASERILLGRHLYNRGWIHQEVHLALSNLFCTERQLWWACLEGTCCETYPGGLNEVFHGMGYRTSRLGIIRTLVVPEINPPFWHKLHKKQGDQTFESRLFVYAWLKLVQIYSGSITTQSDDKLVAIGGIVELLREWICTTRCNPEPGYFSGMWRYCLLEQLTWCAYGSYRANTLDCRWTGTYRIPTWSWASINGAVFYDHITGEEYTHDWILPGASKPSKPLAKILSLSTTGLDPLGRTSNRNILKIQGATFPVSFKTRELDPMVWADIEYNQSGSIKRLGIQIYFDCSEELLEAENDQSGYIAMPLLLQESKQERGLFLILRGIVLHKIGDDEEMQLYKRCGYFDSRFTHWSRGELILNTIAKNPLVKDDSVYSVDDIYLIT